MDRKILEALVWKNTHSDYRLTLVGIRYVMHLSPDKGTHMAPMFSLSEAELTAKLPRPTVRQ